MRQEKYDDWVNEAYRSRESTVREKLEAKVDVADSKQIVLSIVETEEGKFVIDSDIPEVGKVKLNMEIKTNKVHPKSL